MMEVLQINLRKSGPAMNLARQVAAKRKVDIMLISEQPRGPPDSLGWKSSTDGLCAVYLPPGSGFVPLACGSATGLAWMRSGDLPVIGCYTSKNSPPEVYGEFLNALEAEIRAARQSELGVLVGGDFNAKSPEWGSNILDARGVALANLAASLDLLIGNMGREPTFRRRQYTSIINITLHSSTVAMEGWAVLDTFSDSDHQYIVCRVAGVGTALDPASTRRVRGWAVRALVHSKLEDYISREAPKALAGLPAEADRAACSLEGFLTGACNAAMPKKAPIHRKRAVHCWTPEIAELCKACVVAQRAFQRAGRRAGVIDRAAEEDMLKKARKTLRVAIKRSKERCWLELCNRVEQDP